MSQRKGTRAVNEQGARQVAPGELRRLRRALDLTQWAVADRAGCSQASIVRAERGRHVEPGLLKRIFAALLAAEAEARSKTGRRG